MKYIRTKDGRVIGFEPKTKDLDLIKYLSQFANYQGEYAPINQADTIEELCDRFVIEYKQHNEQRILKTYIKVERNFLRDKMYELNRIKNLYGAIWTEWGLKYVAKMNDKGELELL